jgi:extracellular factor (EF) 3-hydroxypalmitic acid methyl ester biosynthesis protein
MENSELNGAWIIGQTSQNVEVRATPLRLSRYGVVFELYGAANVLQLSEVLSPFKVYVDNQILYSGRAVVKALVDTGPVSICEATLEDSWIDVDLYSAQNNHAKLHESFEGFLRRWQRHYKVLPEYKVLASDMQTFLTDLRLWVEQIELGIRAMPTGERFQYERELGQELTKSIFPPLDVLFEKFESLTATIPEDLRPIHRAYIRRQIHSLVLCSPFAFRTVHKPLGYAGDYEMVNMILRDPHEGGSLFGKMLNRWFIKQPPAEAHRNRIKYLHQKLVAETARLAAQGKTARIYNLGCGPAQEIQAFLQESAISDRAQLTLIDFNEETLRFARSILESLKNKHGRSTSIEFIKKSVAQVLKSKDRRTEGSASLKYDFIYCAGLFDYLTDALCRQLMSIFYDMLAPGGLLVTTNVDSSNPIRRWLGDILDWHLIYRTGKQLRDLGPKAAGPDFSYVQADHTGVNIFLEVRKPVT